MARGASARMRGGLGARQSHVVVLLMIVIAVGSLTIYVYDVASSYGRAVLFVAVPMVAWALTLITIPIAVVAGRRSSLPPKN